MVLGNKLCTRHCRLYTFTNESSSTVKHQLAVQQHWWRAIQHSDRSPLIISNQPWCPISHRCSGDVCSRLFLALQNKPDSGSKADLDTSHRGSCMGLASFRPQSVHERILSRIHTAVSTFVVHKRCCPWAVCVCARLRIHTRNGLLRDPSSQSKTMETTLHHTLFYFKWTVRKPRGTVAGWWRFTEHVWGVHGVTFLTKTD